MGKTGTSESFFDSDNDGKIDVDNPRYSVVVITPNVSHKKGIDNTKYRAATKITRAITDYLAIQ